MKNVNPLILIAAEIKKEYFHSNPTTLTLAELKKEILEKYDYVMTGELTILLIMVEREYHMLKEVAVEA
jgi:hypothetical protein